MLKRLAKTILIKATAGALAQHLLGRTAELSQYLMGIGSGSSPDASGERILVRMMRTRATPGQPLVVFDVGANTGQFLSMMCEELRDLPFLIHAFEPSSTAFAALSERASQFENVTLNNVALGKETAVRQLFADAPGSGLASLSKRRLEHFGLGFTHAESVKVRTLDGYCEEAGIGQIDLLKLDVEGHELDALHGAVRMLRENRVRMISFEFGGCNIDSRTYLQDFHYFFEQHGMKRLYRITPAGTLVPLPSYRELDEQFRTTNYLVLRDDV